MGQTPDEIVTQIDRTREDLKSNLQELESRARETVDWRSQFRKHPGRMVVAAVVGGALAALSLRRH